MLLTASRPAFPCTDRRLKETMPANQHGFSLLEVMIALLVLAVGLLGLAALQNMGLRLGHESYQRTQATFLISDIIDRMRANPRGAKNGNYLVALTSTPPAAVQDCSLISCISSTDMANYDLHQWIATVAGAQTAFNPGVPRPALVGGRGEIALAGVGLFDVTVDWLEQEVRVRQTVRVQLP